MKLIELARLTNSQIETGNPDMEILGAAGLDLAGNQEVSFLANPRYTSQIATTAAGAVFLGEKAKTARKDLAVLRAEDPYVAYTLALRAFHPETPPTPFIHPSASIDDTSRIGSGVEIGANSVIGRDCEISEGVRILPNVTIYDRVSIGERTVIHAGASIRENCEIGSDCIIHNNVTVGSDGFGYAKTKEAKWLKIPQVGRVVIEDDVEIGANSAIDRASVGESRIRKGSKIDNLVQIGHSCTIDEDSLICAQTGLAGSSKIGKRVILAGQVGIAGHLEVGDDVNITAKSATSHDVAPGKTVSGIPAFDNRLWLRSVAAFRRLGELSRMVRRLEKTVKGLEEKD